MGMTGRENTAAPIVIQDTVDTVDTVDAPIVIQDQAVDARCRIYGLLRALNRFIGTRSFSLNSCLFAT